MRNWEVLGRLHASCSAPGSISSPDYIRCRAEFTDSGFHPVQLKVISPLRVSFSLNNICLKIVFVRYHAIQLNMMWSFHVCNVCKFYIFRNRSHLAFECPGSKYNITAFSAPAPGKMFQLQCLCSAPQSHACQKWFLVYWTSNGLFYCNNFSM